MSDAAKVEELKEMYDNMNAYQKTFVAKEKEDVLKAYMDKLEELRTAKDNEEESGETEETEDE